MASIVNSCVVKLKSLTTSAQIINKQFELQGQTAAAHSANANCFEIESDILEIKKKSKEERGELITVKEKANHAREILQLSKKRLKSCKEALNCKKSAVKLTDEFFAVASEMKIEIDKVEQRKKVVDGLPEEEKLKIMEALFNAQRVMKENELSETKIELESDQMSEEESSSSS